MLQNILQNLLPQLVPMVVTLIVIPLIARLLPLLLPATGHLFDWVKGKANTIQNDFAKGVLERLTKLAEATVLSFEQTRVQEIKDMLADGQITKEELQIELQRLKDDAMKQVKDYATAQGLWEKAVYIFSGNESDLQKWVDTTIEAACADLPPSGVQTNPDGTPITPPAPSQPAAA